ncbi:hypothetical protein [Candidatus Xianfuyuplasma coldseepsis]|uniref:Aminoacyl-tRNA synthetase class I anticodon-binding domain-containing protein n=1 Tax=Candidatus Xianfuyuplasma coldseepsis TaxID=2782163 RepID=A0A7L7KNR1_9MOLU|nr:hypothetical protein [Xianfuyuplasma coldseepsis]QMS84391.1 hypothetical protein G4Z02_01085 [Xianfuyuplasma coldseepsis]
MNIILCCNEEDQSLYLQKIKDSKHKILFSSCDQLEESLPVVVTLPDINFYGHVSPKRLPELFHNSADDLKIQTSRLYDVEMEKYLSESQYRKVVIALQHRLEDLTSWTLESLQRTLDDFLQTQSMQSHIVIETIKMALIKTTKGPDVISLLYGLGQQESLRRMSHYLQYYKHKI